MPVRRPDKAKDSALINASLSEAPARQLLPPSSQALNGGLVDLVLGCLDDAKAEETSFIDLQGKTSIADAMVVATGRSSVHVSAIADRVIRALKDAACVAKVEGLVNGDWVLIDAGDLIVHIFRPEVRQFYNLEKMWGADRPLTA